MAEITDPIALAARDELPETWNALLEATTFGEDALKRRLDTLMYRVFGGDTDQESLSPLLISFMGKRLALDIIIPGIDFWSKQALSHSAGERESKGYKDRAEDLKELQKMLLKDCAALLAEIETELPFVPRRLSDTSRVLEAGFSTVHVTADPFGYPPMYGLPEETTSG